MAPTSRRLAPFAASSFARFTSLIIPSKRRVSAGVCHFTSDGLSSYASRRKTVIAEVRAALPAAATPLQGTRPMGADIQIRLESGQVQQDELYPRPRRRLFSRYPAKGGAKHHWRCVRGRGVGRAAAGGIGFLWTINTSTSRCLRNSNSRQH